MKKIIHLRESHRILINSRFINMKSVFCCSRRYFHANVYPEKKEIVKKQDIHFWRDLKNQREFFDDLSQKLNFRTFQDWYKIDGSDVVTYGGDFLPRLYGISKLPEALQSCYPELPWDRNKFIKRINSKYYWKDVNNQRSLLENMATNLKLNVWQDWYLVTPEDFVKHGGEHILHFYGYSTEKALMNIYNHLPWDIWKFSSHMKKIKEGLERIEKRKNIQKLEDWYFVDSTDFDATHNHHTLNSHFKGSILRLLQGVYPEYPWKIWKFKTLPYGFWNDVQNIRDFFSQIEKELGITKWEEWYQFKSEDVTNITNGQDPFYLFGFSIIRALIRAYPDVIWDHTMFNRKMSPHREMINRIGLSLGVQTLDDWYNVTRKQVKDANGDALLAQYNQSLFKALKTIFPEKEWNMWRFQYVPFGFWDDEENIKKAVDWVAKELNIVNKEDWYSVSKHKVAHYGIATLVDNHGGLLPLLMRVYPEYPFDTRKYIFKKNQKSLFTTIQEMFPSYSIHAEYLHSELVFEESKKSMELDIFIPALNLAFEYQGQQHYRPDNIYSSEGIPKRDDEKRIACKERGITLIEIPYWWDFHKESLLATIHKYRPDVVPNPPPNAQSISEIEPQKRVKKKRKEDEEEDVDFVHNEG